jgi:hypothetical protein
MTFDMDQGTYDQTDLDVRLTQTQLPHLGILSSPPGTLEDRPEGEWRPYYYDATLGKDQTIYILDTGFNWGKNISHSFHCISCLLVAMARH